MKTKLLFMVALIPLLGGCATEAPKSEPITVTDMLNRSVTYDKAKLNRVICVGAGALRYYSYIGDMSKIVSVEAIDSKTTFGPGNFMRPYYEANVDYLSTLSTFGRGGPDAQNVTTELMENIIAKKPGIIISFLNSAEKNDQLQEGTKIPVIALKQGPDAVFDQVTLRSFKLIADIFGKETRYNELSSYIESCKNDFANLTMSNEKYYVSGVSNWGSTDFYGTFNKFPVFKYAKVKDALAELEIPNPGQVTIDKEKLTQINPDKIFIDGTGFNNTLITPYKTDSNFKEVVDGFNAFKNGETYKLMPYAAYFINLEVQIMSTYYVASIAHPTEFASFDLETKYNEITTKFNGKALYSTLKSHPYGIGGYEKFDIKDYTK